MSNCISRAALRGPAAAILIMGTITVTTGLAQAVICSPNNDVQFNPPGSEAGRRLGNVVNQVYTFGNGLSFCGNGNFTNQTITSITINPSCQSTGPCDNDPGSDDGDVNTPAIAFNGNVHTSCPGGDANISVNSSNPYAIVLTFASPLVFPAGATCNVSYDLLVREVGAAGSNGPQSAIQQQQSNDGICSGCGNEPPIPASGSSSITLTCPPCSTNICAPQHCDPVTVGCANDIPENCADNDPSTADSCDPTLNDGAGGCVHTTE